MTHHHPQTAQDDDTWNAQLDARLRNLHRELLTAPVPPSLAAAADQLASTRRHGSQWWRWGGIAASLVLAFAAGWIGSGFWDAQASAQVASAAPVRNFARQAAAAHVVYLPEVRHPVEVPAAQQEHLVQWLSKRLGRPLKVPVLAAQGYELIGGRLLPGDDGARAQFMYQNATGERITLYVGAVKPGAGAASVRETAFRFSEEGAVPSFYWVDQGFGYALAGRLPRAALQGLATSVYQQL